MRRGMEKREREREREREKEGERARVEQRSWQRGGRRGGSDVRKSGRERGRIRVPGERVRRRRGRKGRREGRLSVVVRERYEAEATSAPATSGSTFYQSQGERGGGGRGRWRGGGCDRRGTARGRCSYARADVSRGQPSVTTYQLPGLRVRQPPKRRVGDVVYVYSRLCAG